MKASACALALSCLLPLLAACGAHDPTLLPPPTDPAEQPVNVDSATLTPAPLDIPPPGATIGTPDEPEGFLRSPFYLDETELLILESYPYQLRMIIRGSLPTPCATLHWSVESADKDGRIHVELYSLQDPDVTCIQILHSIEETIPLGSYTEGNYSVWINGELIEELEL